MSPRLNRLERKVLLAIPSLFPDGDSDELKHLADRESISFAIAHLKKLNLLTASSHDGVNPLAFYYRDVELTAQGEELRRDLSRFWLWRWLEREWKWVFATTMASVSLALSLWNFFNAK